MGAERPRNGVLAHLQHRPVRANDLADAEGCEPGIFDAALKMRVAADPIMLSQFRPAAEPLAIDNEGLRPFETADVPVALRG